MAQRRTVDLLPEIFRTPTNQQFFAATLDQLTAEPQLRRTQGWIGRRIGPGVNPSDHYVTEPTAQRTNYQLEPGIVQLKNDTNTVEDAMTYPGLLSALDVQGADVSRADRLFQSDYYTWDPFCDFDKFVNYSQYYWLPQGPNPVDVSKTLYPLTDDFEVTRATQGYTLSGLAGNNPTITLVRGGNYVFSVNQPGSGFWIQAAPGITGRLPDTPNISSRDVLGVTNNGAASGDITFDVPLITAQNFYSNLTDLGEVNLATTLSYSYLNGVAVSAFLDAYPRGIDGITNLDGQTLIFIGTPDPAAGSLDVQYSIWRVQYDYTDPDEPVIRLIISALIPSQNSVRIISGDVYNSTSWYRDSSGTLSQVPLLTAAMDTLYYQDSTDPQRFGIIKLINPQQTEPLDIEDIIGARDYTSPNGVRFTNGLRVQFRGAINPASWQDREFYVEGVGTGPGLQHRVGFIAGEAYYGPWHWRGNQRYTGSTASTEFFQLRIWDDLESSIANPTAGEPQGAPLPTTDTPGAVVGQGIRLLPVEWFITPEPYTVDRVIAYDVTPFDSGPYDEALSYPAVPDYLTVNRASRDRNAWSRSNRWFHVDVLAQSARLNNQPLLIDNDARARRPIIEFRADLRLYNTGTLSLEPVTVIDFEQTDAFSNINGRPINSVPPIDGEPLSQDARVIFAADLDPDVRNRIYQVNIIDPDGTFETAAIVNLVPAADSQVEADRQVVCVGGVTLTGKSFRFDGTQWIAAQDKTSVNQAPLFDVFDAQGRSFGDLTAYPASTFSGSRLFGYAIGTGTQVDPVLGLPLRYRTINNVGDILFSNDFYNSEFVWVNGARSETQAVSTGLAHQNLTWTDFSSLLGWLPAVGPNRSRQTFRFAFDGAPLLFDVPMRTQDLRVNALQLFVSGVYIQPEDYTVEVQGSNTLVTFLAPPPVGSIIEAEIISDQPSAVGFYQIPLNLENNALNQDSSDWTLGTIRNHYQTMVYNLPGFQGEVNGSNNTRDLGAISTYGTNVVQHSSPLTLAGLFLRQQDFDLFGSLRFNSQEYEKFKARLIDTASQGDFVNSTINQILDATIATLALGRNSEGPFYWSDMLPSGEVFDEIIYDITPLTGTTFDLSRVYDFTTSNFQGVLLWLNDVILQRGRDYVVSAETSTVTVLATLTSGDQLRVREYSNTAGSFVPNTPTKLGLYPAYQPAIYVDTSAQQPVQVIRGHDGSITRAWGDARDQILLEFENRVYNNLKTVGAPPLSLYDVSPGAFRVTDYSLSDINQILSTDFLSYVAWNRLDYVTQQYLATDQFTYNYSQSSDRITGAPLLGAWRGIYRHFYDTESPNLRPWEMLGIDQEPDWWQGYYGPAPYTGTNLVLWDDLEQGIIREPGNVRVDPKFVRPGLTAVIPADSEGNLLSPLDAVVKQYDATSFRRSWTFGDGGPVEASWRNSSSWPFAVMRLLALTRPAQFFGLFADRDRYRYDADIGQFLWNQRYRLEARGLAPLYGDGTSRASYIDWIIDYNRQLGADSTQDLTQRLSNLDLRLCWRAAGFTDKRYLKVRAERSTPDGSNTGLLLPDESWQVLLYRNTPDAVFTYSAVVIQKTNSGWTVVGYNSAQPYFNVLISRALGPRETITAGGQQVRVPTDYSNRVVRVPYGYEFRSTAAVCDFLLSYGALLQRQGWQFETQENGLVVNWQQMAQEFLYWSNQGWVTGSVLNLNPGAVAAVISRPGAVVDSMRSRDPAKIILNQNRQPINPADISIIRDGNTFRVESRGADTISYVSVNFTAWENLLVFDNTSVFADLLYDPNTGSRQSRLGISGWLSADWNGLPSAPGWIINQTSVQPWSANRRYTKGEIVLYKNRYYAASQLIPPAQEFDPLLWLETEYDEVMTGILPNAANSSDQLAQAYDIYSANLEGETNLFSYGLIGFRPRPYMAALDLDDVSQVNLYQQFLGDKGTRRSLEVFSAAALGSDTAQYEVFENWAMLRGQYGATASRAYFELRLDEALLTGDPSLVAVIDPGTISAADQTVTLDQIWKQSYRLTTPDILPTLDQADPDRALPTAGYVDADDIDISVFSLEDRTAISENLSTIGVGTTLWVAAINPHDWNVYRVEAVPATVTDVCDNLDGRSAVYFSAPHDLAVGDILIVRYFDITVDGVYTVRAVPNLSSVLIDYVFTGSQTEITGQGLAMTLGTARVTSANRARDLPFTNLLTAGARIWVDNDGHDAWQVIQKQDIFQAQPNLIWEPPTANALLGSTVAQGFETLTALVGAPGEAQGGSIYSYLRGTADQYTQDIELNSPVANTAGYGTSLAMGSQQWAMAGAPQSRGDSGYAVVLTTYGPNRLLRQSQVLLPYDDLSNAVQFGHSVAISQDERWAFVSAPGGSQVYAWTRVDVPLQGVTYTADGSTSEFVWTDSIVIDPDQPNQMQVTVDGTLTPARDPARPNQGRTFRISTTDPDAIEFIDTSGNVTDLPEGSVVTLRRRESAVLDRELYLGVTGNVTTAGGSGTGTGAEFTVAVQRGVYSIAVTQGGQDYNINDQITILGNAIGGGSDLVCNVLQTGTAYQSVGTVVAGATTLQVNTTQGLSVGQQLTRISGLGGLAPNTEITDIDDTQIVGQQVTDRIAAFSVVARSTGPVADPLAAAPLVVDQLRLIPQDLVLLLNQTDRSTNGIYRVIIPGTGNDGVWLKIAGSVELNNQTVAVTGPVPPRVSLSAQLYAGTQWLINSLDILTLDTAITASGFLEFQASPGPVSSILLISGSSTGNTSQFNLTSLFTSVADLNSFSVTVDDQLQRPGVDYTFNTGTGNVIFDAAAIPATGAEIEVEASTYWTTRPEWRINNSMIPAEYSIDADSVFGSSVSTNQSGQFLVVGAPGVDITVTDGNSSVTLNSAGSSYIFDRAVERFTVTDAAATTITTQQNILTPTTVTLNGEYLPNLGLILGPGYRVTGARTLEITVPLSVGDVIEVGTNQWQFLQRTQATTPFELARSGWSVDQCRSGCAVYVSAPWDSTDVIEAGSVEYWVNQARVYGTTTSLNDDPTLTAGQTLRVNTQTVVLSDPRDWSLGPVSGSVWATGTFVQESGSIYRALQPTPADIPVDNVIYWQPSSWLAVLAQDITATVSNVLAAVQDQRLVLSVKNFSASVPNDRLSVLPGTGTLWSDVGFDTFVWQQRIASPQPQTFSHFGSSLSISADNRALVVGAPDGTMIRPMTLDGGTTQFDAGSTVFADGQQQSGAAYVFDLLDSAAPSTIDPSQFVFGQQLVSDNIQPLDLFGSDVDYTNGVLLAGAPRNDQGVANSNRGVVLQWENLNQEPAWSVIRQQTPVVDVDALNTVFLYDLATGSVTQYLDYFDPLQGRMLGAIAQNLDYTGTVDPAAYNVGTVNNWGQRWAQQQVGKIWWDTTRVRFVNPNQGNIVSTARRWGQLFPGSSVQLWQWTSSSVPPDQYTGAGQVRDVTSYSTVSRVDDQGIFVTEYYFWVTAVRSVAREAGKTLSIETLTRYIQDPRSSGIPYLAPVSASTVALYNATTDISAQDTVLHIEFDRRPNTAVVHQEYQLIPQGRAQGWLDDSLYSKFVDSLAGADQEGLAVPDPTLPVSELYGTAVRPRQSMFANRFTALQNYLGHTNAVLLGVPVAENRRFDLLNSSEPEPTSAAFYRSARINTTGNGTATLTIPVALSLILQEHSRVVVNGQLAVNTPSDTSTLSYQFEAGANINVANIVFNTVLEASDSVLIETAGLEWNLRVADYQELLFQDLTQVPIGYRWLVAVDSRSNGRWSIYSKTALGLQLQRVQNYDVRNYWSYADWYQPGFDPRTRIAATVPNTAGLDAVTVPVGSAVRVTANAQGNWEIYLRESAAWRRVALQSGTIQFDSDLWDYGLARYGFDAEVFDAQYFDEGPTIETRLIIQAINQEIFTNELLIERNRLLTLMFEYIMTEQIAPTWLIKTSLVDVDHTIGELTPSQIYRSSNQDFVVDYLNEVKPYHTQIREFNLIYNTQETVTAAAQDFDVPAAWVAAQATYVSPVLDDTGRLSTTSSRASTDPIWSTVPWSQWYNNRTLSLEGITVTAGGSGYTVPPQITVGMQWEPATAYVIGDQLVWLDNLYTVIELNDQAGISGSEPPVFASGTQNNGDLVLAWSGISAQAVCSITAQGAVVSVTVTRAGSGYTLTPEVVFTGGNGTGARASAVMDNNLVRNLRTGMRFDRVSATSDISDWQPGVIYTQGDRVRYAARAWSALVNNQNSQFDTGQWQVLPASQLTAADRIIGYYEPTNDMPGRELSILMSGVDFPGVQVLANGFDGTLPLDAIYESQFEDGELGLRASDINVDGGAFVDPYHSYAPEEMVPGLIFDAWNMTVNTTPGSDWLYDGHGSPLMTVGAVFDNQPVSYAGVLRFPAQVTVLNQNTQSRLVLGIDYTIDWVSQTITVNSGATSGDPLTVNVWELGGGNQLYRELWLGQANFSSVTVPVNLSVIDSVVLWVNGTSRSGTVLTAVTSGVTQLTFPEVYGTTDSVLVVIMGRSPLPDGGTVSGYTWSVPVRESQVSTGTLDYAITSSLAGTNPANIIVDRNGQRVRPAEGVRYVSDGTTTTYYLPDRGGYSLGLVVISDVAVYVDDVPLTPLVGFLLDDFDDSTIGRSITLLQTPPVDAEILISVRTASPYMISGNLLQFKAAGGVNPQPGDVITVTTWNDTRQQDLETLVFQGPSDTVLDLEISEGFDSLPFDAGDVENSSGTYDYSSGLVVKTNTFDVGRDIVDANRVIVTQDGRYLTPYQNYTVQDSRVLIGGPVIPSSSVVAITVLPQSVLPGELNFRIFQDMAGQQTTFRILPEISTTLTQPVTVASATIAVADASKLPAPNLAQNNYGTIIIDGERITYRVRDTINNLLTGLRRGTQGTAAADHALGAQVTDASAAQALAADYQDREVLDRTIADGTTVTYTANDLSVEADVLVNAGGQIRITVNGVIQTQDQYTITGFEPVSFVLAETPPPGVTVLLRVTQYDSDIETQEFTSNGQQAGFNSTITMEFRSLPALDYTVLDLSPVTIEIGGLPLLNTVFEVLMPQAPPNQNQLFFLTNGVSNILATTVDLARAVIVRVGGVTQSSEVYSVESLSPVQITFDQAPPEGAAVDIAIRRGLSWYQPGATTASNGVALQETNTQAARFLRGIS